MKRPTDDEVRHQLDAHALMIEVDTGPVDHICHATTMALCRWFLGEGMNPPPTYDLEKLKRDVVAHQRSN